MMQTKRKLDVPGGRHGSIVMSFVRGLDMLRVLAQNNTPSTITEVADRTGMTRAGARRLLLTLKELGYVKLSGRHFSLTPRIMELGCSYSGANSLWSVTEQHLQALVNDINETASAGMLDDLDVVYVLRLHSPRPLHIDVDAGSRLPAHAGSIGRVLLANVHFRQLESYFQRAVIERYTSLTITEPNALRAELESVRAKGYSIVVGEVDEGICGVAVPLREPNGRVFAAIGVGLARTRATEDYIQGRVLPCMRTVVDSISHQMRA